MDKELLLQNYFSNRLTEAERKLFDKLLDSDSEFKSQFQFEKDLQGVIKNKENHNLKAKLISFEKEIATERPSSTINRSYRFLAIAASITLLVAIAWLGYKDGSSNKFEDLYAMNFKEYPNTVYTITRGDTTESIERDAFVAYESKNYNGAIEKFNQIPVGEKEHYVDFYLAQSYINIEDYEAAKDYLKKIITSNNSFVAESHWYLAMIALKQKDKNTAKLELQKLVDNFEYNKEKAVIILKELY